MNTKLDSCIINNNGEYECTSSIYIQQDLVKNGKLIIKFKKVNGKFYCENLGLTTLEGCPEYVERSFHCSRNKLTSLEGGPKEVYSNYICYDNNLTTLKGSPIEIKGQYNAQNNINLKSLKYISNSRNILLSNTGITSLEHLPKKISNLNIKDCKSLETFNGSLESLNTSTSYIQIKCKASYVEHTYWQRLLIGGVLKDNNYYKELFGLMVGENYIDNLNLIKWPDSIINIMPKKIKNLYFSKSAGKKFNLFDNYNILKFEDFVLENLETYIGELDLSENIKTNTNDLIKSIDLEKVDIYNTLNILVDDLNLEGLNIEQLADNKYFINALDKLSLKKEEPTLSKDSDTFLTSSLAFMGIYSRQVLEIQDPEYLLIQIGNTPITLYKVTGSIKDFYDRLTSKTIEITSGDNSWIYVTSNSGNNWELKNNKEGIIFKNNMTTKELENSFNKNTKIKIIN